MKETRVFVVFLLALCITKNCLSAPLQQFNVPKTPASKMPMTQTSLRRLHELKLFQALLRGYDSSIDPTDDRTVTVRVNILRADRVSAQAYALQLAVRLSWVDPRLRWSPESLVADSRSDAPKIYEILVPKPKALWKPKIRMFRSLDERSFYEATADNQSNFQMVDESTSNLRMTADGTVFWSFNLETMSDCDRPQLRSFPQIQHRCSAVIQLSNMPSTVELIVEENSWLDRSSFNYVDDGRAVLLWSESRTVKSSYWYSYWLPTLLIAVAMPFNFLLSHHTVGILISALFAFAQIALQTTIVAITTTNGADEQLADDEAPYLVMFGSSTIIGAAIQFVLLICLHLVAIRQNKMNGGLAKLTRATQLCCVPNKPSYVVSNGLESADSSQNNEDMLLLQALQRYLGPVHVATVNAAHWQLLAGLLGKVFFLCHLIVTICLVLSYLNYF